MLLDIFNVPVHTGVPAPQYIRLRLEQVQTERCGKARLILRKRRHSVDDHAAAVICLHDSRMDRESTEVGYFDVDVLAEFDSGKLGGRQGGGTGVGE